jgi:hypothetical protein
LETNTHSDRRAAVAGQVVEIEPALIGATANPRLKWANRGAEGVWKATTNYVDHSGCTEADAPHITGETPAAASNATFALSNDRLALDGFACFKLTKTVAAGTGSNIWLDDYTGIWSGFAAGDTVTKSMQIYNPSSGGVADQLALQLSDDNGSWQETLDYQTTAYDQWVTIDVTRAMRDPTTNFQAKIYLSTTLDNGAYCYIRFVQVEKSAYATPHTPTTRAAGQLQYLFPWPQQGTMCFWWRPYFNYDIATNVRLLSDFVASGHLDLYYYSTTDKLLLVMTGSTTTAAPSPNYAFDDAKLRIWHMVAITWDIPNDSYKCYLYDANNTAGTVATNSADIGTVAFNNYLQIGSILQYAAGYEADSLFADLMYDDCVWTAAQLKAHYDANKPWFDMTEYAVPNRPGSHNLTGGYASYLCP